MRIKWYQKTLKQSFNINQAKTSTIAHQSNTIKYNQSLNISNQINNQLTMHNTNERKT